VITLQQAEADFLSETDMRPKSRLTTPNLFPPRCLDTNDADVIVLSSDLARFRVHKSVLSMSSPFFRDMFSLPQPPDGERLDGLPLLHLSEDAEVLHSLITMLYPIPSEIPDSYDKALALLSALQKYDMAAVQSSVRAVMKSSNLRPLTGRDTFRAYGIASAERLSLETETTARLTLDYPMTFEYMGDVLSSFRGWALQDLVRFRRRCRDSLVSCLESLLDFRLPPSDVWVGCYNPLSFSIASWLQTLLSDCVKELQQTSMNSLLKPSGLRDQYLAALRAHITQTNCSFCSRVHIMHGETFCVEIENKLATTLDQVGTS
jgi:BTB/POZ domain